MNRLFRFFDDNTLEVAIFAPGDHHGNGEVWTEADLDALVASYDPALHEAPNVIGHAQERASNDPAYGWVESLFKRDGYLWARLKQVPQEFKEWVEQGFWKKRSVEIYTNFQGSGQKYLRALAWLGAQPPAVMGMPDAVFAEDSAWEAVAFEEDRESKLRQLWSHLKEFFQDDEGTGAEDADADGPIAKTMNREDALDTFERLRWIAADELYRIVYDEDMPSDEKQSSLRALFDELKTLLEQNGDDLIHAFTERSAAMNTPTGAVPGAVSMTAEELATHTQDAVKQALAEFQESIGDTIKSQVDEGLKQVTEETRKTAVKVSCARFKEKGLAPALVNDIGLDVFMERLGLQDKVVFAEAAGEQSPALWFEEFVTKVLEAAKKGTLLVDFSEVGKGNERTEEQTAAAARALATYEEDPETYKALGVSVEDLEKYDGILQNEG